MTATPDRPDDIMPTSVKFLATDRAAIARRAAEESWPSVSSLIVQACREYCARPAEPGKGPRLAPTRRVIEEAIGASQLRRAATYSRVKARSIEFARDVETVLLDARVEFVANRPIGSGYTVDYWLPALQCIVDVTSRPEQLDLALARAALFRAIEPASRVLIVLPYFLGVDTEDGPLGALKQLSGVQVMSVTDLQAHLTETAVAKTP